MPILKRIKISVSLPILMAFLLPLLSVAGEITIRDSLGRRVKIPDRVERIVCLQPELLRILVALNRQDRVVAIDRFPVRFDHLMVIIFPGVRNLPVVSITGEDASAERILRLDPDLVLASPSKLNLSKQLSRKLNSPVVSLSSVGSLENLLLAIEILSKVTGNEKRGREIIDFMRSEFQSIREKSSLISEARRPGVYLSFWGSLLRSPFNYEPVELAGGRNLASQFKTIYQGSDTAVLNMETLLSLDPEIILVHGNYPPEERKLTVEDVLSDPRLQAIKAVRNQKVYYTFGFWYWWDPALVLVESHYLSDLIQNGYVDAQTLISRGEQIFSFFYGRSHLFQELCANIRAYDWFQKKN